MNDHPPLGEEPPRWVLVFHRRTKNRFVRLLACGEFKHVSAYAFLPAAKVWLVYDVSLERVSPVVVPDGGELAWLIHLTEDSECISMPRRDGGRMLPLFGWCVPAIAHLLGLRTWALRPDALYRFCKDHGGVPLNLSCNATNAVPQ